MDSESEEDNNNLNFASKPSLAVKEINTGSGEGWGTYTPNIKPDIKGDGRVKTLFATTLFLISIAVLIGSIVLNADVINRDLIEVFKANRSTAGEENTEKCQTKAKKEPDLSVSETERELEKSTEVRRRDVAKLIVNSMYSNIVTKSDLTAAEELVRGLTFDKYEEKAVSQVLIGVKITDFEGLVERIAERYNIPEDKKGGILDGQYAEQNTLKTKEFIFNKGDASKIIYCKIATIKTSGTHIDMAMMIFKLDFKLAPRMIETVEKKFWWFISLGTKRSLHFENRNLSERDQDNLLNFFRAKALRGFTQEYPSATHVTYRATPTS